MLWVQSSLGFTLFEQTITTREDIKNTSHRKIPPPLLSLCCLGNLYCRLFITNKPQKSSKKMCQESKTSSLNYEKKTD